MAVGVAAILLVGGAALYQRYIRLNFHTIVAGQAYRSAQPTEGALKAWARRYGLKTIVNLRGPSKGEFLKVERRAAREAGVRLIDIRLTAGRLPTCRWL